MRATLKALERSFSCALTFSKPFQQIVDRRKYLQKVSQWKFRKNFRFLRVRALPRQIKSLDDILFWIWFILTWKLMPTLHGGSFPFTSPSNFFNFSHFVIVKTRRSWNFDILMDINFHRAAFITPGAICKDLFYVLSTFAAKFDYDELYVLHMKRNGRKSFNCLRLFIFMRRWVN